MPSFAVRGATEAKANTAKDIQDAVKELLERVFAVNKITPDQLVSIIFTSTPDLNACFPAEGRENSILVPL